MYKCTKCNKPLILDRFEKIGNTNKIVQFYVCTNSQCEMYLKDVKNVEK